MSFSLENHRSHAATVNGIVGRRHCYIDDIVKWSVIRRITGSADYQAASLNSMIYCKRRKYAEQSIATPLAEIYSSSRS